MRTIHATSYPTRALEQGSPPLYGLLVELVGRAVRVRPRLGDRY